MDDIGKATVDLVRLLSSPLKEKLATMETRALAAEAERDALTAKLNRDNASTHGVDCWGWGHRHYECALEKIDALIAEIEGEK